MKFALVFAFNNFDIGFRMEGNLCAQVVIGLITIGVMIWIWKKSQRKGDRYVL